MGYGLFMQQKFCGLHSRITVEPLLNNIVVQEIGNGKQGHTLMVRHPAADNLCPICPGKFFPA
jgi:hypothetical protein